MIDADHFIRKVGLCLLLVAILGTARVQAQNPTERFALLIGVDDYAQSSTPGTKIKPLKGPGNDVAIMKGLLVDRYGFVDDSKHILTLVGKQATHAAIAAAFKSQLTDNAAAHPNAIIVFYFSGHGSQADDENEDEGDGLDETLVAYDSRTDAGRDILDDEVNDWLGGLRKHTKYITLILDSCHSESGARDLSSRMSRNLASKVAKDGHDPARRLEAPGAGVAGALLPGDRDYALLSGSLAYESSYEDMVEIGPGAKAVHGLFTYYLVQALRQQPVISYEQLIGQVSNALSRPSPDQHPQAEGATEGYVFEGTGLQDDPYIPITRIMDARRFMIEAGEVHGLRQGAILAVYSPGTRRLSGESGKIANARLTELNATTSIAEVSRPLNHPLPLDAKVAVVTPFFGLATLQAQLSDLPGQATSDRERGVLASIAQLISTHQLVSVAAPNSPWDVAVSRGCVSGARLYLRMDTPMSDCKPALYLSAPHGEAALMGAFIAEDDPQAAAFLAGRLEARAKQENLRGIDNASSPLRGLLKIAFIRVDVVPQKGGIPLVRQQAAIEKAGAIPVHVGENFLLKVSNDSDYDLHVATIALGSSGRIRLVGPNPRGDLIQAHRSMIITRNPWKVGPPLGLETYKVIATSGRGVNFRVIEQPGPSRAANSSPLEWLLNSTTATGAKDSAADVNVSLDDWVTARLDLLIVP